MNQKLYGIAYRATCAASGKSYIGITKQKLSRRWNAHVLRALNGGNGCTALAAAIRKYGPSQFTVEPVASAWSRDGLIETEICLIKQDRTLSPDGYNLCAGGQGQLEPSIETRSRMRSAQLGKKQSPDLVEKRVAPLRGRKCDPAVVEKRIAKQRGKKRASWGNHTAEAKARMSVKRKTAICTPAMREAMSLRMKGNSLRRDSVAR